MMLKNYLKVVFRNILRQNAHSFINITGLAIGFSAWLLLFLWLHDELNYDSYHEKADLVYRVISQYESDGKLKRTALTPAPLGPALVNEFPEVRKAIRFAKNRFLVTYKRKFFYENIFFTDPGTFEVFTLPLIKGSPETAFVEPYSLIISRDIKDKYFKEEDPIGRIINLDGWRDLKITGVFENIPQNSHFRFDFLGRFQDYAGSNFNQWGVAARKRAVPYFITLCFVFVPFFYSKIFIKTQKK